MSDTIILRSTCIHPAQDALHGPQMRVHNKLAPKSPNDERFRCTVCLTIRSKKGS